MADDVFGRELIEIAIGVEQRGIAFYDVMARSADETGAARVFEHLVTMERQHLQMFQAMLGNPDEIKSPAVSPDSEAYLKSLLAAGVFTDDLATSEMATRVNSDLEAVELAIVAEKDSILLYCQLREMMFEAACATFDRVMAEEKKHLEQLTGVKIELAKRKTGG